MIFKSVLAILLSAQLFASQVAAPMPPRSYGEVTVTYYCACEKCCGKWALNRPLDADGNTTVKGASGNVLTPMISAACASDVPFGTTFDIEYADGTLERVVCEDRGGAIQGARIDIYVGSDQEAHDIALKYGKKRGYAYVHQKL